MRDLIRKFILETFSFGYGNNDYLSDLGDPDIKDKMGATAFQPDPVGVGLGLVNEFNEDLEYNHVDDATKDEFVLSEKQVDENGFGGSELYTTDNLVGDISKPPYRKGAVELAEREKKYMQGSVAVDVKKQCRLAGLGNTSKACNQGEIKNLTFSNINEGELNEEISKLEDLPFKNDILALGGEIYSVGGAVRDEIIGKESKDLDVLITGIPIETLERILSEYGKVDAVGKSFGVLKFKAKGSKEEIDITIPRTEKSTGEGGYRGFDVESDHTLSIEDDLKRRDLTINAIAKDIYGNFVDPYGGIDDIKRGVIREVNPDAFSEDPLRMLRAIQFSSRFNFKIDEETYEKIKNNTKRIKEISPERILIELDKIATKGDAKIGAYHLINSGLYQEIFNIKIGFDPKKPWDSVENIGDFIYLLLSDTKNSSDVYKEVLKGDLNTYKYINALEKIDYSSSDRVINRMVANMMYGISPKSLESDLLPKELKIAADELLSGKYPKSLKDVEVSGNDLISLGFKQNKELGEFLKRILSLIYSDKLKNNKEEIIDYVKREKNMDEKYDYSRIKQDLEKKGFLPTPKKREDKKKKELTFIAYSAIVLNKSSRERLLRVMGDKIPENWEVIADHVTINMGSIKDDATPHLDLPILIQALDYAINDKVLCVGVNCDPIKTKNSKPHITIAVNREGGAKPRDCNDIPDNEFINLKRPLRLSGYVREIPHNFKTKDEKY